MKKNKLFYLLCGHPLNILLFRRRPKAFTDLKAGQSIAGPAIVEADTTTVLLLPGDRAQVTDMGWLDIAVGK